MQCDYLSSRCHLYTQNRISAFQSYERKLWHFDAHKVYLRNFWRLVWYTQDDLRGQLDEVYL